MQAQDARTPWMAAAEELQHLLKARKGDRNAFLVLLRHYHRPLYRLAFALTRDVNAAVVLTREAALTAHETTRHLPEDQRFFPWVAQILRARVRVRRRSDALANAPWDAGRSDPAVIEVAQRHLRALDALDGDEQAALVLRVTERLPYAQIESVLRTAPGTALAILARARTGVGSRAEPRERAA